MEPSPDMPRIAPATEDTIESPAHKLKRIFESHRGERHVIAIRGYPDPDSIACAMAHALISLWYEIESTILYFDDISHHENRALVKTLNIEMVRYGETELVGYDRISLVDAQVLERPTELIDVPMMSIVDHHKPQGEVEAEFIDIREDAGSASSIYAEYFAENIMTLERENPFTGKLASALLYGIRSDTDDYLSAREIDYRGAAFLAPYADLDLLKAISMQSISPRTMEITQRAYANKVISDTYVLAGVGFVRDEDRDSIGQAADYLLQREGVDTVVVYGIVHHQFVDGSLRTTSNVVDPDRFLKELFGYDPHNMAYGGGRADKGAFKIPLGPFSRCGDRDLLWRMVQRTIEDIFFNKIGITRE